MSENETEDANAPEIVDEVDEAMGTFVSAPKLMRIASMTRAMLEEIRTAPVDAAGRKRLVEIHEQSLSEMQDVLSEDLRHELNTLFGPLSSEEVTEPELRIAQAQLVGWLEGLFAGIQATLWSQQAAAQSQLQEMRMKAIEAAKARSVGEGTGQYL